LFFYSSGIIWEEKRKRFRALNVKTGEILEKGFQKYATELELGHPPPARLHLENKMEVSWFFLLAHLISLRSFLYFEKNNKMLFMSVQ
jgi:hypothetical protein